MAQALKINGISIPNTSITGYTYDGVNTFTITQNDGTSFTATINELSATTFNGITFSGGTFYGDGGNLTNLNAFSTFSSTTVGETSVIAANTEDTISYSGINLNILTDDTNKIITFSASTGGGGGADGNDYVTGTTKEGNAAVVRRDDGTAVLTLSGGSNVSVVSGGTNLMRLDVSIPADQNTFVTGYTYNSTNNTFTINDNLGSAYTATITTVSGLTVNGDLTVFTGGTLTVGNNTTGIIGGGTTLLLDDSVKISESLEITDDLDIRGVIFNTLGDVTINDNLTVTGNTNTQGNILSGGTNLDQLFTQTAFKTISTAGETDIVADSIHDTLTLSGVNINIIHDATNDKITFSADTESAQTQAEVAIDFSFDGTYTTSSASFGQIPLQVVIQSATTYNSSFPTMSGTLICDVSLSDTGISGEFDLYNLTDSAQVTGSVTSFTDADGLKSSASFSLGSSHFDDTFRVRMRRVGGVGSNNMRIRAAQLILTLT